MNEAAEYQHKSAWRWLIVPAVVLLVLGIDQGVKSLVVSRIPLYQIANPIPSLAHLFDLTFITNTGAAFGLFQDSSLLFVLIAAIISIGIVVYLRQLPQDEWLLRVSLALQLGGALGNLIDRLRLGYVIDFANFHQWPVFNFADTAIVVGVGLLAYYLLLRPPDRLPAPSVSPPTDVTEPPRGP